MVIDKYIKVLLVSCGEKWFKSQCVTLTNISSFVSIWHVIVSPIFSMCMYIYALYIIITYNHAEIFDVYDFHIYISRSMYLLALYMCDK